MKDRIWISIDGGGTKTQICACGADGSCIYDAVHTSANYKTAAGQVEEMFREAFEELMHTLGAERRQIAGILLSAAGCDTEQDQAVFEGILEACGFEQSRYYVCNDTEAVYFANCSEPGVCVVAGTGSIACAFDRERMVARAGGWGAPFSDLGSGYWIGAKVLEEMLLVLDGIKASESRVFSELSRLFYKEGEELPWTLSLLSVTQTASAARSVLALARQEDPLCLRILEEAADHIADLIEGAVRKAGFTGDIPILTVGGLMKDPLFTARVREKTAERLEGIHCDFRVPKGDPARDALSFAVRRFA